MALPPAASRRPAAYALGAAAVAALALAPRLASWSNVFTPAGVRFLVDGDPYYHLRRAGLILEAGAIVWRDPALNYPAGAEIPWPPLFDLLLAGAAWLAGLGSPSPGTLAAVAAVLPVVLGLASIALAAAVARQAFGPAAGWGTAVLLALSPAHVRYSVLGRPDQHVLEVLLFTAVLLAFGRGLRDERLRPSSAVLLGAALALSFWNWLGSALTLLVLGAACVVAGVSDDPERPGWGRPAAVLAAGAAVAAALLALTIGLAGPAGALRTLSLGGLSGFQVLLPALTAIAAAALRLARVRSRALRAVALLTLPALVAGLAALVPAVREPVLRGLAAAGQVNAWYGSIGEFMPVLGSGVAPVADEVRSLVRVFGLAPALAAIGLVTAVANLRRDEARAPVALLAVTVAVIFAIATLRMARFAAYGSVPLAIFAWLGLDALRRGAERLRPRAGALAAAVAAVAALAPTAPALAAAKRDLATSGLDALLARVREAPARGDRRAVLAPWSYGHHVLVLADRPVVASPFGTEGGAGAMEDLAAFYSAADPAAAELILNRRAVQFVLVRNPVEDMALLGGHGGRGGAAGARPGGSTPMPRIPDLVPFRLYQGAGSGTGDPGRPALEGFRMVDEDDPEGVPVRLFELVPGATARVRGGAPSGRLVVSVALAAPFGGEAVWRTARRLDERGEAVVRLPFATGPNGRIVAREYLVSDGARTARVQVTEEQVVGGGEVAVALEGPG